MQFFVVVVVIPAIILGFYILIVILNIVFEIIHNLDRLSKKQIDCRKRKNNNDSNKINPTQKPNKFDFWLNRNGNFVMGLYGLALIISLFLCSYNISFGYINYSEQYNIFSAY